ncbi:MAG: SMI1/KNR4 family protein, partial [Bacteroidota bacterium]
MSTTPNPFDPFYAELAHFIETLQLLQIGYDRVQGFSEEEIQAIESKQSIAFPLSYRSYLRFFGKSRLFFFFDGNSLIWDQTDERNRLVEEILAELGLSKDTSPLDRPWCSIGQQRMEDYVTFLLLDESDNPPLRFLNRDPNEPFSTNGDTLPKVLSNCLLVAMLNKPSSIAFAVSAKDLEENPNVVQDRWKAWSEGYQAIKKRIEDRMQAADEDTRRLYEAFLTYDGRLEHERKMEKRRSSLPPRPQKAKEPKLPLKERYPWLEIARQVLVIILAALMGLIFLGKLLGIGI